MSARKHRPLTDLYNVTSTLLNPEITPVLSGSYRMQGPLLEADRETITASSGVDQESNCSSINQKACLRVESEKCNLCSSPSSSCLHIKQAIMGSKLDETTEEASAGNALSSSVNDGQTGQLMTMSNRLGVNPNRDSFSENAIQRASSRISDASGASGSGSLLQKVDCSRGSEILGDSISHVISTDKNSSCFLASESCKVHEGYAKALDESPSSGFMDKKCDAEDIQESSGCRSAEESLGKVPPSTSAATSHNSGLMESPPGNRDNAYHSAKEGKSIPRLPESNESEKDSPTLLQEELLKCEDEHLNPSFTKEVVSDVPRSDPTSDASREEKEDVEKSKKSSVFPDIRESSQSDPMDDNDDSDIVEQDVKVCDICGDSGREDFLAVCSKCIDGAEHTYCMQKPRSKVPEGYWLCEECKYDEEMEKHRQEKTVRADGNGKYSSSRKSSGGNPTDEVGRISRDHSPIKILGKRYRDDVKVLPSAKKQAVEACLGSPKKLSIGSVASLSRDNSLRHMEKGKEKLSQQSSTAAIVVGDDAESAGAPATVPQTQTPRGTFKSNSLSSINVKPKVKLVVDVNIPKQKMVREPSPVDSKEGSGKSIGKSTSFRTMSSGRIATGEAKVKMLSPSFSINQDNKGTKHTKERSLFERKSSFKLERPLNSPRIGSAISIPKSDQKSVCRGENAFSSISNNHQPKVVQSDRKSSTLSKPSSLVSRRGSDLSISLGDVKRQSALANGCSSSEEKPSPKDAPSSISHVAEKPTNLNEFLPDETPHLRESANLGEKMRDNGARSKKNAAVGGRADICQKCKEVGHLTQFCTVEGLHSDLSAAKSVKEVTNGSNDLKAAIEAARLRKPDIYQKHRVADQSNDLSLASKDNQVASQDQSSCSSIRKNIYSGKANEGHSALLYSTDPCKPAAIDSAKQYIMETSTSKRGDGGLVPFDGRTSIGDLSTHFSSSISVFWKTLVLPEHEFIWQGQFEIHRTLKVESCDGLQAHLSTCASPKVLGAVNKFSHKIILNEVPRLNAWPIQFQEFGVREDNIALYFFAKDVDSYEKSYKTLLENMIKNDLALKGIVDGVELLIFPSTQLPEKSQRWNMMFFLWAVFRGKKTSGLQQMPVSPKQLPSLGDIPTAIMSLPGNICSVRPIDKDLSSVAVIAAEMPASKDGDGAPSIPSLTQIGDHQQINVAKHDGGVDSSSLSTLSTSTKACKEIRCTGSSLEGGADSIGKSETIEVQAPGGTVLARTECMTKQQDPSPGTHEMTSSVGIAERVVSNEISNRIYQMNHGNKLVDETVRVETRLGRDIMIKEPISTDLSSSHLKNQTLPREDSVITSAPASRLMRTDYDDKYEDVIVLGTSKKQKTGPDDFFRLNGESRNLVDSFVMQNHGVASGSSVMNLGGHRDSGNAERHFFPVTPHPVKDIGLPWKMHSMEDQLHARTPNLELALGGETKPHGIPSFLVGKVEKKAIQEHRSDEVVNKEEEEDDAVTASLSLSLAFPFPEKEQNVTSTPKPDQLTAGRRHADNSLLLFGGGIRD